MAQNTYNTITDYLNKDIISTLNKAIPEYSRNNQKRWNHSNGYEYYNLIDKGRGKYVATCFRLQKGKQQ